MWSYPIHVVLRGDTVILLLNWYNVWWLGIAAYFLLYKYRQKNKPQFWHVQD